LRQIGLIRHLNALHLGQGKRQQAQHGGAPGQ